MSENRWLILSGSYGDGHEQAARAIVQSAGELHPDVKIDLVDYTEWTHPYLHRISRSLYLHGMKKFPSVYGYIYNATKNENTLSKLLKKGNRLGSSRLVRLLREAKPALVVSTFPLAAGAMSILKQYGLTDARTATVITDHSHHNHWIYPHTDLYLVGSEYVKTSLAGKGIGPKHIEASGIPIRRDFRESYDKPLIRQKHGLDPELPTLLWMGGGYGLFGDAVALVRGLERLSCRLQLVIVCGRNRAVEMRLGEAARRSKHSIHVKGYVDYVAELMAAADLLVTKPGGLSTSEALAMGLPMVLYNALPGQEEDNARFLVHSGVAAEANLGHSLTDMIDRLIRDPERLRVMQEKAMELERKHAAPDAVRRLWQLQHEASYRSVEQLQPSW
ncbi:MGDG synthase family glycosyltransferase [Paenibacillus sp. HJGM_3]|uniref:MGDG synthase family glycosyltransferase n=1 Tax=Paenibacillus sp. HJGM_3 TaxID=3379816 RepID=UPI00385C6DC6